MPSEGIFLPTQVRKMRHIGRSQKWIRGPLCSQRDWQCRSPRFQKRFHFRCPRFQSLIVWIDMQCKGDVRAGVLMSGTNQRVIRQCIITMKTPIQLFCCPLQQAPTSDTEQHITTEQRRHFRHNIGKMPDSVSRR